MTITLKLLESVDEIENNILSALATQFNKALTTNKSKVFNEIIGMIPKWISNQPEIQSLSSGGSSSLIGQFGINTNPAAIVNAIIQSVTDTLSISIQPYNNKLKNGGIEINIQPSDLGNLLGLREGHVLYNSSDSIFSNDLHWLEWLLMRGDETIIIGYEYNPQSGLGRSKLGNMKPGGSFRVPPQFSGTINNNFITRALSNPEAEQDIAKVFKVILGA